MAELHLVVLHHFHDVVAEGLGGEQGGDGFGRDRGGGLFLGLGFYSGVLRGCWGLLVGGERLLVGVGSSGEEGLLLWGFAEQLRTCALALRDYQLRGVHLLSLDSPRR